MRLARVENLCGPGPLPLWQPTKRPHTRPMGPRTQLELEAVRYRLDKLAATRFDEGLSALEQAEYDALVEREIELLRDDARHDLRTA